MTNKRISIPKQPEWSEGFIGWTKKFIRENKWRCDDIDDFDDLMHDAYLIFRHILASYPLVHDPKTIMALYKTAMSNAFHDKSKEKTKKYKAEVSYENLIGEDLTLIETLGENNNEGYLRLLLNELPPEVRLALDAFHDDEKLALLRKPKPQSKLAKLAGITAEPLTFNEMLCKIINLPRTKDLVGLIRSALTD